jgi:hypothetical protein
LAEAASAQNATIASSVACGDSVCGEWRSVRNEALDRRWRSRIDRAGETRRYETNLVDNIERLLRGETALRNQVV